jgi:hypothetical protein
MLQAFGEEIWIADGSEVIAMLGFHYPTRMVVIRLHDGQLFIWSPVALTSPLRSAVDLLGPVRHIVAPNSLHDSFIADWASAYPHAQLYATPELRQKRPDLNFDAELEDAPSPLWEQEIDQVIMRGNRITSEVVFFHRKSATVIFTDLLQQFPKRWFKGWRALIANLDLMTGAEPSVPRKFRTAFADRRAARASLKRILSWPAEKVLMAHGTPVTRDGRDFVRRAFRWLGS